MPRPRAGRMPPPARKISRALPAAPLEPQPQQVEAWLPSVVKHQTLECLAYQDIRQAITEGRFVPGQRIVVSSLAAASGVSRIPVLQALRRLETEGFVRIAPHKNVVVATLSPQEFRERFLLLATLEALSLREAAGKITPDLIARLRSLQAEMIAAKRLKNTARGAAADSEFHRTLWELAELPHTLSILQSLWDRGEYYRIIMHARRGGFMKESLAEHEKLLGALEANNLARAAQISEEHHLESMRRLIEVL